jgi:uncharacterized membrane protein YkvA (DUF1232 family)
MQACGLSFTPSPAARRKTALCAALLYWPFVSLLALAPGMLVLSVIGFFDDFL